MVSCLTDENFVLLKFFEFCLKTKCCILWNFKLFSKLKHFQPSYVIILGNFMHKLIRLRLQCTRVVTWNKKQSKK